MEYWSIREGVLDPPWSLTRDGSRMYAGLEGRIAALDRDRARWTVFAKFNDRRTVSSLLPVGNGNLFAGSLEDEPVEVRGRNGDCAHAAEEERGWQSLSEDARRSREYARPGWRYA